MRQQLTNTAGNITKFNDSVRSQVRQVHASGEQVEDQLAYFGKHTLQPQIETFIEYLKLLWNSFEDGTSTTWQIN